MLRAAARVAAVIVAVLDVFAEAQDIASAAQNHIRSPNGERQNFRCKIMSRNSNQTWNTKYGPRRVRHEAPTLEEAIAATQGLSDELNEQAKIAAELIGLPYDQVRTELLKGAPPRKHVIKSVVSACPTSAPRTIVVERKPARRMISAADRAR